MGLFLPQSAAELRILSRIHPHRPISLRQTAPRWIPAHLVRRGQQQTVVGGEVLKRAEARAGADDGHQLARLQASSERLPPGTLRVSARFYPPVQRCRT